jgi:hypothetical protein
MTNQSDKNNRDHNPIVCLPERKIKTAAFLISHSLKLPPHKKQASPQENEVLNGRFDLAVHDVANYR